MVHFVLSFQFLFFPLCEKKKLVLSKILFGTQTKFLEPSFSQACLCLNFHKRENQGIVLQCFICPIFLIFHYFPTGNQEN
uniref:Uncharacterized protein n=1 Tax=Parietochloris pseudoalveolaris TaxID=3102 RepID=A0A097KLQ6_9CHLO|nr:hypothetical protein [Parietochloris pseudoalveolaris]AIT94121.1 hypothetical protein [Parietochloris pseudoalveolaris]